MGSNEDEMRLAIITDKAARGSSLLDQLEPGWASKVDLARLDLSSECDCVIGQLHGDYNLGLIMMNAITAKLFVYDESEGRFSRHFGFFSRHFGFTADINTEAEYDKLTGAWREEITKRLQPPQEQHGQQ